MVIQHIVAYLFGAALLISGFLFVPQVWRLWRTKDSKGISIPSFIGFNLMQLVGVLHGYFQSDNALLAGMFFSLLTCGSVTILAAYYARSPSSR